MNQAFLLARASGDETNLLRAPIMYRFGTCFATHSLRPSLHNSESTMANETAPQMQLTSTDTSLSSMLLLVIAYLGFISLGLPHPVAGVAWASVRERFSLPQSSFGLIFIGLGCG